MGDVAAKHVLQGSMRSAVVLILLRSSAAPRSGTCAHQSLETPARLLDRRAAAQTLQASLPLDPRHRWCSRGSHPRARIASRRAPSAHRIRWTTIQADLVSFAPTEANTAAGWAPSTRLVSALGPRCTETRCRWQGLPLGAKHLPLCCGNPGKVQKPPGTRRCTQKVPMHQKA